MSPRLPTARPRNSLILSTARLCEVIRGRPNAEASQMSSPGPSRVRRQGAAPLALLLAGPNGAGKTTAQSLLLPPEVVFLNADLEAERLISEGRRAEGIDIAAGRAVLTHLEQLVATRTPFCLETNLAGRGLVRSVRSWQSESYVVRLYFVALRNPELALARVAERVAAGGHNVPDVTVRRRWQAGLRSLFEIVCTAGRCLVARRQQRT